MAAEVEYHSRVVLLKLSFRMCLLDMRGVNRCKLAEVGSHSLVLYLRLSSPVCLFDMRAVKRYRMAVGHSYILEEWFPRHMSWFVLSPVLS